MSEDAENESGLERSENRVEEKWNDSQIRLKRRQRRARLRQREELEMQVEDDAEAAKQCPLIENKNRIDDKGKEIPHRAFLESCFRKQIGLGIDSPQKINIYSFTNKRVAKGYQRVVTTCQGMYYEMRREEVDWEQWNKRRVTVGGDWCWRAEGVSLYNPTRENLNRKIVQHRFAINPRRDTPRKMMRKGKY